MVGVRALQRTGRGAAAGQVPSREGSLQQRGGGAGLPAWPWAAVAATVLWSLWELRATVVPVRYLVPAWQYLDAYDTANAAGIAAQQLAQHQDAPQVAALAEVIRRHGGGRAYAGSPADWGQYLTIGAVPLYQYLDSLDIDEAGYTLRTASLMTQPEYHLDPANPGDYALFGIRYLILPTAAHASPPAPPAPPGAVLILRDNLFLVYELPASSYIRVADTTGSITANRADIGSQTLPYLQSALPGQGRYLTVAYAGTRAAEPTLAPRTSAAGPAGTVLTSRADLADGTASAVVRLRRRAVVVLSASYDPGWSATIDGHPATVQMVSPALAGVAVPPGTHHIAFRYTGFGGYPELLALAVLDLLAFAAAGRPSWRRRATASTMTVPAMTTRKDGDGTKEAGPTES